MMFAILLYLFTLIAAVAAFGILIARHVFHAVLLLIVCLTSVAGLYLLLSAEFIAATQLLVYAGGIVVLIIFGIMLTQKLSGKGNQLRHDNLLPGLVVSTVLLVLLGYGIKSTPSGSIRMSFSGDSMIQIGNSLFSSYSAPFEAAGLLLLVSLVAATVMARHNKEEGS